MTEKRADTQEGGDAELERYMVQMRPKDRVLALMVGVVAAWVATNNFGYVPTDEGLQIDWLWFAVSGVLALGAASAIAYRLLRNWRMEKFYKKR